MKNTRYKPLSFSGMCALLAVLSAICTSTKKDRRKNMPHAQIHCVNMLLYLKPVQLSNSMPSTTKTNNLVTPTVKANHQSENGQQSSCMTEYYITDHSGDVLNS